VNAKVFGNWEMQAGDPAEFAFSLAFLPNPQGDDDRAVPEERGSWGAFSVWVRGENLCAHIEQGELVDSVHWYMLPLIEWLVDSWDPLLHEERLPLKNEGISAAESLGLTRVPPLSLKEVDEFAWLDTWAAWWSRHCWRAAREGGLFPDLYLRRYRDSLEFSTGNESLLGIPQEFIFLARNRSYLVDPAETAEVLFQVLSAAVQELRRRLPGAKCLEDISNKLFALGMPDREASRMAWLAGLGDDIVRYRQVSDAVDDVLAEADEQTRKQITGEYRTTPLLVIGSAYAQLLYGAISPATALEDVVRCAKLIVENYVPDATPWLSRLDIPLDADEVEQFTPGEQGSRLGEAACELLGGDTASWVDVQSVIQKLGISLSEINLSDVDVRAISVFGPTQIPHIFCNTRFRWGDSPAVRRFTLAHELCHLLIDREYGDELAVATGPWAPVAIEQRANAFAAAFLMPTWLLRDALALAADVPDDLATIKTVSARLRVSASSLIDRLFNLGEITFDDRGQLRAAWMLDRERFEGH
jgi:Zn-dependent peptidase ImmA (M78 family)